MGVNIMSTNFVEFLNNTFQTFDYNGLLFMHNLAELNNPFIYYFNKIMSLIGYDCVLLLVIAVILCIQTKNRKYGLTIIFSVALTFLINSLIIKKIVMRPRPYLASELYNQWFVFVGSMGSSSSSFPSGHVSGLTAGLFSICFYKKDIKWFLCSTILIFFMAVSRVFFVAHYPSDCLFGFLDGIIIGFIGYCFVGKTNIVKNIMKRCFKLKM